MQKKLIEKKGVGLVWGRADYADIFQPTTSHSIVFCILVTAPNATTGDGRVDSVLGAHPPAILTPYRPDCNKSE